VREERINRAFVTLADTLVDDYDVIDLLDRLVGFCVELLPTDAAGIVLGDARRELRAVAASEEAAHVMELLQLQSDEGPCLDCFRSGRPVARDDLPAMRTSWPAFTEQLQGLGFRSAQALPMRLREETIGALNLFRTEPGRLSEEDLGIGQAMADVATVGLIQERTLTASELLATQLQTALTSRVQLEQAKGMLAERTGLPLGQAFQLMRDYARSRGRRLSDVAAQIIEGVLDDEVLRKDRGTSPNPPRA
jgi:transcriptional regulator with GAF, ATPase, and Fis domain